jgi:L-cysteine/cystine lyase
MRRADDEVSGRAYLRGLGLFAVQRELSDRARAAAAALIGAAPDDVALTQNTTHGMNLGVAALDWSTRDRVLSITTEHPGCLVPLHILRRRHGVEVELLSPPVTPKKLADALDSAPGGRVRLLALSHVDWTTGELLPLRELCAVASERGILTLVDGAQSVGNVAVDVPATGADMYAFTGHKWVLGPEGMGTLYVRPGLEVTSPNVGFASLPSPADFDLEGDYELRPDARRFEASTMSPLLCAGFAAAAGTVLERGEPGFEGIRSRAEYLTDLLAQMPRVEILSPMPAQSGLVTFRVRGVKPKNAAERLLEEHLVVRYLPEPNPGVRASTHLFNSEDELARLAAEVAKL